MRKETGIGKGHGLDWRNLFIHLFVPLGLEHRTLGVLDKCSTIDLHLQSSLLVWKFETKSHSVVHFELTLV